MNQSALVAPWLFRVAEGPHSVFCYGAPEEMLHVLTDSLCSLGNNNVHVLGQTLVVLNPLNAEEFARRGFAKADVRAYLWEHARRSARDVRACGAVHEQFRRMEREAGRYPARYQTALEFAGALDGWRRGAGLAAADGVILPVVLRPADDLTQTALGEPGSRPRRPRTRRRGLVLDWLTTTVLLLSMLALVVLVGAASVVSRMEMSGLASITPAGRVPRFRPPPLKLSCGVGVPSLPPTTSCVVCASGQWCTRPDIDATCAALAERGD